MLSGLVRYRGTVTVLRPLRLLSTQSETDFVIDKAKLSKLRKKTGFPLLKCKNALQKFNNDVKEAESWMREMAQKEGWEKAGKLQERPMSQGLVGLLQLETGTTIVEVNCETDFVARNELFQSLVTQLVKACHDNLLQREAVKVLVERDEANSLKAGEKTLADLVALTVGTLGENMALRRVAHLKSDTESLMTSFVHAAGPPVQKDGCQLGKFATVVKMTFPDQQTIARQVCQQIIAMNPKEVGEWTKQEVQQKGQKKKKSKGEPEEPKLQNEPESKLLDQEFLLGSGNVREFLMDNGPQVVDFVRLECGEDLGEDD